MTRTFSLALCSCLCIAPNVFADKNTAIKMKLAEPGSPVATESFDGELPKIFSAVKGQWQIVDGVLSGKELVADKHAAVLNYQKKNHNSAVRFSFKFDGETKGFNFSMNHAGGHLFRVVVSPSGMTLNLDKDKKDPSSKAQVLASAKTPVAPGQWHTMLVEMKDNRVVAQIDNGTMVDATNEKLDTDKPNYRFVMKGDSLVIDDLQIWDLN